LSSFIILGAGFSKPAGLPLGNELFSLVIEEAKRRVLWKNIIEPDIQNYLWYQKEAKGIGVDLDNINFEDFLAFLDYEHFLGLKGSDTWSSEGNRSQLAIRNLIAYVLNERQKDIKPSDFELYLDFVDRLNPGDFIYTFNYDTVLETALETRNISYRLFPTRLKNISYGFDAEIDLDVHEVVVIKVHGSIDWFDISGVKEGDEFSRQQPIYTRTKHYVFSDPSILRPWKVVNGLYWPDSPLQNIYRINDLDTYFENVSMVIEAPLIISPSLSKTLYLQPLREFWEGFSRVGGLQSRVGVIGFSMPFQDEYILQPMYHLITNFQQVKDISASIHKSNFKMIDYRPSPESVNEYKDRYKFVDWKNTDAYFNGFDRHAIDVFFTTP
jgi:hypothetical protein